MRVRDGPAAVRGDAPPPRRHWRRAGKAAREGAPSQKTCRAPHNPNPSRKEDSGASLVPRRRRLGGGRVRRSSSPERPAARSAVGRVPRHDRRLRTGRSRSRRSRGGSSRSRRRRPRRSSRSAQGRRSSPSTTSPTSRRALRRPRSQASRRTSRRSPAIGPTSSSSRTTRRGSRARSRRLGITVVHHDGAKSFKGAYQQIRQLGSSPGHEARGDEARRGHEGEDRARS